jgi:amidase
MNSVVLESAVRQLELLGSGAISVVELAEAHIRQIERLNPELNALVDFDAERVRVRAGFYQAWRGHHDRRPLFGLPVTVKSSIATRGLRCEIGSQLRKGEIPRQDAVAVARLRAAGALIVGTTNCPEFLMAYETDNLLYGQTRNPWDLARTPGGSSGGESAAISAGMSAAGLGSDSGGSVRVPAHFTGICSLKPTPGRIPGRGHLPPFAGPFQTLGAIGPMARTIGDLKLLFRLISGHDPADPGSSPRALQEPALRQLQSNRIGFFPEDGLAPVTAETRAAVNSAAQALREAGFRVEPFRPSTLNVLGRLWTKFFVQCGAMFYAPQIRGREKELSPIFTQFLELAAGLPPLSAPELLEAWAQLDLVRAQTLNELERYPVLLCPVASIPAFRHGERSWSVDGRTVEYLDAWRYAQWFNALACPAAVVPVAGSPEGLPIGVQIVARPFEDETALGIAAIVDAAFGYRPPPMACN